MYQLYGVIVHVGESSKSGHYYSFVQGPDNIWRKCNDGNVEETTIADVLA